MCTVFEETRAEGKIEGKIEGKDEEIVETGYEFGLPEPAILERLQKKLAITPDQARKYLEMFRKSGL